MINEQKVKKYLKYLNLIFWFTVVFFIAYGIYQRDRQITVMKEYIVELQNDFIEYGHLRNKVDSVLEMKIKIHEAVLRHNELLERECPESDTIHPLK